jgi:hypothetical protein
MALNNNIVTSSLPKKPKIPCAKALISKASYNSLRFNIKSSLNISLIKGNKGT